MRSASSLSASFDPEICSGAAKKRRQTTSTFPLHEEELAQLWEGQRFPRDALRTAGGEILQVVYRGRRSPGPGPDFVDAILADERGMLLKGDIELHVLASAFRAHGHDRDPRYDGLVLHLVFQDDLGTETVLSSGRRVDVVELAPWVARRREELRFWLTQPVLWEEPCKRAVARMGWPAVKEAVLRMGEMRFRQKEARFAAALRREDAQQVMYEALLRSLGYRENAEAFSALARFLPYRALRPALSSRDPLLVEARLLEAAGLTNKEAGGSPPPSRNGHSLPGTNTKKLESVAGVVWATAGVRPVNHPRRRLAGAARLLVRKGPDLLASLEELLQARDRKSIAALVKSWEVAAEGAWKTSYGGCAPPALVGRGRALELLVNAVLPFAAAWGRQKRIPALSRAASLVFKQLPRSGSYGAIRFLDSSLRPLLHVKESPGACYQQGLLYLYHQYCTRGGCDACPFRR